MFNDKIKLINGYLFGLWGLFIHLIVLWGVLDANFHSPILQGLPTTPPPSTEPPAKRLYLFVSDGLRFRTFIEETPPFLRKIMQERGAWGVSHTRMPTESRPGNVAIAAGLYEDPSALFKGWKENPVDFDSVFNRSSITWAWGSPDIIPMFSKSSEKVRGQSYPHEWQNFDASSKSAVNLDSWVFDRFDIWLKNDAESIKNHSGVVLLFHLLACDTSGHASKPHSQEYKENMRHVDREIERVVKETEEYFKDSGTAYVFTADHGMTDWGSHGSGSTDETETPFVVWGAGINPSDRRQDVEQADITPLMASLLGLSIPVNNEGVLRRSFLSSGNEAYGAQALRSNLAQLIVQVKGNRVICSGNEQSDADWREKELEEKIQTVDKLLESGRVKDAIEEAEEAIVLSKRFLIYYRGYQRNRLVFCLTIAWLGWIILLFAKLLSVERRFLTKTRQIICDARLRLANIAFIVAVFIIFVEDKRRPGWRLLGYSSVALLSLWLGIRSAIQLTAEFTMKISAGTSSQIIATVFLLATISAGMIVRWFFSVGMIIVAVMQKYFIMDSKLNLYGSAFILAIFPLLPVVGPHPQIYVVLFSLGLAAISLATLKSLNAYLRFMELGKLAVTVLVITGCIDGRNFVSWIILAAVPVCISFYPTKTNDRILGVVYGLLSPLALLSASYEPLFYLILAAHLLSWPKIEQLLQGNSKYSEAAMNSMDVVHAAFFMLYTLLCFFGTGNMASISSFDPTWTRHFVTVFSPFTMSGLILFKFVVPMILVGCACRSFASSSMFLSVLLLGDCLSLPLMYGITTEGSWLDIGTAISRYTIAITLPCLLLVLNYLSEPLMTLSFTRIRSVVPKKKHLV